MLGALRLRGRFQERCAGNSSRSGRLLVIYWVVSQDKEGQIIHLECTHLHNLPSAGWEFFIWDGRLFWELAIKGGGEKAGCKNAPCHPAHPLSATIATLCRPLLQLSCHPPLLQGHIAQTRSLVKIQQEKLLVLAQCYPQVASKNILTAFDWVIDQHWLLWFHWVIREHWRSIHPHQLSLFMISRAQIDRKVKG